LLATQAWMMVAAALLAALTLLGTASPWVLLSFTFLLGLGAAMNAPAWQAIVPELVPRRELAQAMIDATAGARRIATYSAYEKTRLEELQRAVPELAEPLGALIGKLVDLLPVVRNHVYHPDFQGSFSLKYILTPLVPDLSYSDLVIVDGRVASVEIARLLFVADRIPQDERDRVRRDLLAYCKQDTWAMVRLLEELRKLAF